MGIWRRSLQCLAIFRINYQNNQSGPDLGRPEPPIQSIFRNVLAEILLKIFESYSLLYVSVLKCSILAII